MNYLGEIRYEMKWSRNQKPCIKKANPVRSLKWLTCKVCWDLYRVIGTWNCYYCILLLLLLVVVLRLLSILIVVRLTLNLLCSTLILIVRLVDILLVLICRLVLVTRLLLLLRRLCWPKRDLNIGPRYRQRRLSTTNFCL